MDFGVYYLMGDLLSFTRSEVDFSPQCSMISRTAAAVYTLHLLLSNSKDLLNVSQLCTAYSFIHCSPDCYKCFLCFTYNQLIFCPPPSLLTPWFYNRLQSINQLTRSKTVRFTTLCIIITEDQDSNKEEGLTK